MPGQPGTVEPDRTFVVGVDGSPASGQALRWACSEAEITGAHIVAVAVREAADLFPGTEFTLSRRGSRRDVGTVRAALHRTVGMVVTTAPVTELVVTGEPAEELLGAASEADLLVLGTRGHRGLSGVPLGGVIVECVRRARCPLVLVPTTPAR